MDRHTQQSGQILLITLLVLSVALTVTLSLISRTTTDMSISSQVEESTRAFSAAEAGIEESLKDGVPAGGGVSVLLPESGASYQVSSDTIGETNSYDAGIIHAGEMKTIWLIHHDPVTGDPDYADANNYPTDKPIYLCWNKSNVLDPAVEVTIYYISGGSYLSSKMGFDKLHNDPSRPHGSGETDNQFLSSGAANCAVPGTTDGVTLHFNTALATPPAVGGFGISNVNAKMIMMRIRPVYDDARIALKTEPGETLPDLGQTFTSCGSSTPGVTRCILAQQYYREPPGVFDYVLYANNGSIQ